MRHKAIITLLLLCCGMLFAETFPVPALPFAPRSYVCCQTRAGITVNGNLDELDWLDAAWTEPFTDIEGDLKPAPWLDTRVKMLWNSRGLYIAALLQEPSIWAKLTQHDDVIFFDNDFEVFIDPDGDAHNYCELELNALGTLWDLFLIKPYRDEHSSITGWDLPGIEYAVACEGTPNDPSDTDTEWSVELFLPWSAFAEFANMPCPPQSGDFWRVNFSRVEWDTEVRDSAYVKIPGKAEHNWVWSPQGLIAMHYPERWGYLFFTSQKVGGTHPGFVLPDMELAKQYLFQLYYSEKQYWMDHGKYTKSLTALRAKPFVYKDKAYKPRIENTSRSFDITLKVPSFSALSISSDGRLTVLKE